MDLITILNRCPGFIYQHVRFTLDKRTIESSMRPRKGPAAICSRGHQPAPVTTNSRPPRSCDGWNWRPAAQRRASREP